MNLIKGCVTSSNIDRICRICLEEKAQSISLFSLIAFKEECIVPVTISEILDKIIPQQLNNYNFDLPNLICLDCMNDIKTAYILLLKYENAIHLLNTFIETHGKKKKITKEENPCFYISIETVVNTKSNEDSFHENYQDKSNNEFEYEKRNLKQTEIVVDDLELSTSIANEEDTLHPCPVCTQEFTALDLVRHAHSHKALKKYLSVPDSMKVSPNVRFYSEGHRVQSSELDDEEKLYMCPFCNENIVITEFRNHIDTHRNQTDFKCDKCNRVFKKVNHLNTHKVKHLKECPYKCEHCGKGFVIKRNYDCHILTHTNDELPHECKFCLKRFSNPEHLYRHQIIHTENLTYSVKYKVFKCYQCLKTYKSKEELKNHNCQPTNDVFQSNYVCKICKKVFRLPSGLYQHNRIIHMMKTSKTLCQVCGKYVSNIYNHMIWHTGEKPFQCDLCEKRFTSKTQLRQHLIVHSGLKPYVCSVCAKAFNNLYNLQVHERIHKGDKCHVCNICNKGFLEKSYLKKHMNVHSKS